MSTIGNILWFILGGFGLSLGWLILGLVFYLTLIGAPIGRACFQFTKLAAFPFGKEIVRDTEVKGKGNVNGFVRFIRFILNIIWFPIGLGMTVAHIGIGLLYCITIVGIPIGIVYLRMGKFILFPFGATVVKK